MEDSISMNGGDGPNSYAHNFKYQEEGLNDAKYLLVNSIQDNLEIRKTGQVFAIADLGCSVGPNTFSCVQTIIQAVQFKFKIHCPPEFHVFFNDTISNDFNTLFKALPLDKQYMVAGVPGSFHGRLFPKGSMNFMHSSFALHWLSKVPEEVIKEDTPAWNKGRISYVRSSDEVIKAFTSQFMIDIEAFSSARSAELAPGGLMVILMPCRLDGTPPTESILAEIYELLGDALADMVKEGLVSEALADSFNLPIYIPPASEVKEAVSSNKHLKILKVDGTFFPPRLRSAEEARISSLHTRATMEGIINKHFGPQLFIDDLFKRYSLKLEEFSETPRFQRVEKIDNMFLLVERK